MSDQSTLWGNTLEFWDKRGVVLMIVGGVLGFAALGATVASSFILWKVAGEAQSELETTTRAHEKEIGKQKQETEEARLETEKLKQVVAWRTIPPEKVAELEKVLAAKPGSVNLRYIDGDPEALYLASQIGQILSKVHWQVSHGAVRPANTLMFGISIPTDAGTDASTLREAFSAAKMPFSTDALPSSGISFWVSAIPGAPALIVGSKAPPQLP